MTDRDPNDYLARLSAMVEPGQTKWDLSPNDQAAIKFALTCAERLEFVRNEWVCGDCHRVFSFDEDLPPSCPWCRLHKRVGTLESALKKWAQCSACANHHFRNHTCDFENAEKLLGKGAA